MTEQYLNQDVGFDEVRWAIGRRAGSYDAWKSFAEAPRKQKLPSGTHLFRLVAMATGRWFEGPWWMPQTVFEELLGDAKNSRHGGGRLFRNYVAQYLALPKGDYQLSVVEILLDKPVYAWVQDAAGLFGRPGKMEQVFLPNLQDRGDPRTSSHARLVHTYWLTF